MKLSSHPNVLLGPIAKKWASRQDFFEEIGQELVNITKERISTTKTDPDGNAWPAWAPSTLKARTREGTAEGGLLFRTKSLYNSIQYAVRGNNIVIETENPVAIFHHMGTKNMPARRFLGMGNQENEAIKRIWTKWIDK